MLSASLQQLVITQNSIALTDSHYHHCWIFPSYEQSISKQDESWTVDKACACGRIQIKNLPFGTTWIAIQHSYTSKDTVHEKIESLLNYPAANYALPSPHPVTCDPLSPKLSAIHLSRQISTMMIQTYATICS